jgi:hypothetical protein
MLRRIGAFVFLASVSATTASAELPQILAGPGNSVPQCVTPGRLMAFLKLRNAELNPRYDGIATQYMRFGEELGMRWDIAFYQMILETGALSYWRGHRAGDVKPDQNNFAGLGATGNGVRGESFKDVETGVRAHLEHIMLYAGKPVVDPVAERTRKVQEWRILDPWQHSLKRPLTFADLAIKWAPGTRHYSYMIQQIEDHFRSTLCHAPDPRPELVREARALVLGGAGKVADASKEAGKEIGAGKDAEAGKVAETPSVRPSGEELAKRAIVQAKEDGTDKRSSLGVKPASEADTSTPSVPYKVAGTPSSGADKSGSVKASKAPPAADTKTDADTKTGPLASKSGADKSTGSRVALAGAGTAGLGTKAKMATDTALPPSANQRCRVWTASYGGQKALIIRSVSEQVVNFTVLDVNDGAEQREAEAFIAAYAKNGKIAGEFASQAQALDKAFELCPEG